MMFCISIGAIALCSLLACAESNPETPEPIGEFVGPPQKAAATGPSARTRWAEHEEYQIGTSWRLEAPKPTATGGFRFNFLPHETKALSSFRTLRVEDKQVLGVLHYGIFRDGGFSVSIGRSEKIQVDHFPTHEIIGRRLWYERPLKGEVAWATSEEARENFAPYDDLLLPHGDDGKVATNAFDKRTLEALAVQHSPIGFAELLSTPADQWGESDWVLSAEHAAVFFAKPSVFGESAQSFSGQSPMGDESSFVERPGLAEFPVVTEASLTCETIAAFGFERTIKLTGSATLRMRDDAGDGEPMHVDLNGEARFDAFYNLFKQINFTLSCRHKDFTQKARVVQWYVQIGR